METTEFYDLHCHFLPGMDDGCKTPEESVRLLEEQYRQGCRGVAATPHYYAVESIENFLMRRKKAAGRLLAELKARKPAAIPNICFGAEVAFRETLENEQELERLCYGKSRYLLLEMPFTPWTDRTVRGVERIANMLGIIPVIAHIERYISVVEPTYLEALMNLNVLIQLNAGNFTGGSRERKALRLVRDGKVQVLGTDSHNITTRSPNMDLANESLQAHGMKGELQEILDMNQRIFTSAVSG